MAAPQPARPTPPTSPGGGGAGAGRGGVTSPSAEPGPALSLGARRAGAAALTGRALPRAAWTPEGARPCKGAGPGTGRARGLRLSRPGRAAAAVSERVLGGANGWELPARTDGARKIKRVQNEPATQVCCLPETAVYAGNFSNGVEINRKRGLFSPEVRTLYQVRIT